MICEICKVSYNSVHYEQYHEHRCTKGTDHVEVPNESLEVTESLEVGEMRAQSEESSVHGGSSTIHTVPCPEAEDLESNWRRIYSQMKETWKVDGNQDVPKNVSDEDVLSFFPVSEFNIENHSDSENEEQWEATAEKEMAVNIEEGISQDLDYVAEQLYASPATVHDKVLRFVRWLCLF